MRPTSASITGSVILSTQTTYHGNGEWGMGNGGWKHTGVRPLWKVVENFAKALSVDPPTCDDGCREAREHRTGETKMMKFLTPAALLITAGCLFVAGLPLTSLAVSIAAAALLVAVAAR